MISREFAEKLKASFESLDARLTALEDTVNNTILEGLKNAADEYEDDVKFSDFKDTYSTSLSDYDNKYKALNGEDADLASDLYEEVKGSEGYGSDDFDQDATVQGLLQVIDDKVESIQNALNEVKQEVTTEPSEEQLAREFKEYNV